MPIILSFGCFLFFLLLGRAFFALVRLRMPGQAAWLLSPAMGLALLTLFVSFPSQVGFAIAAFGQGLMIGLAILSIGILVWRRRALPWQKLLLLLSVVSLWLIATGYPLIRFGYDWLSYANADFANYCLAAIRLLNHGFFTLPTAAELRGQDPSSVWWFYHVGSGVRPGTDFVLATIAAASRITPREAFMPVILAFSLLQACALGGVVALSTRWRKCAPAAVVALLVSPLFGLGMYYQLFAQVGGLALMLLTIGLLCRWDPAPGWRSTLSFAASCAVAVTALLLFYPECAPFTLLPVALVHGYALLRAPSLWKRRITWVLLSGLMSLGLLGLNIPLVLQFFLIQLASNRAQGYAEHFRYYFEWEGWAKLMGWCPFYGHASIYLSVLAVVLVAVSLLVLAKRRCTMAAALAWQGGVLGLMALMLWSNNNGFGLFKLAMFAQPVLVAGLVLGWHSIRSVWGRSVIALALLAGAMPTWVDYQSYALGKLGGPCEAPFASKLGFPETSEATGNYQIINMGSGMEALAAQSMKNKVANPVPVGVNRYASPYGHYRPEVRADVLRLTAMVPFYFGEYPSDFVYIDGPRTNPASMDDYLVEPHPSLSPFNRVQPNISHGWFSLRKKQSLENRLARLLITPALIGPRHEISLRDYFVGSHLFGIPLERDEALAGRTFWGCGRHLLFSVVQPTPEIYLRVAFTRSYFENGQVTLSEMAMVSGVEKLTMGCVGSGAANIIVGPLKPHQDNENALVFVDLGTPAHRMPGDIRYLTAWIRDVSALSGDNYRALKRPRSLERIPEELLENPALEFSGIGEDGWVDKKSWLVLASPVGQTAELRLCGTAPSIPGLEGGNTLTVSINGVPLRQFEIAPGEFDFFLQVPPQEAEAVKIGLEWQKSAPLPDGDNRPAAARIKSIHLEAPKLRSIEFGAQTKGAQPKNADSLAISGIDSDGWIGTEAGFTVPAIPVQEIEVEIEFQPVGNVENTDLEVLRSGERILSTKVSKGRTRFKVPLHSGRETHIDLKSSTLFRLPAPDNRERSMRITTIHLEPLELRSIEFGAQPKNTGSLAISGIDSDGWIGTKAGFTVPAVPVQAIEVEIEFQPAGNVENTDLEVLRSGERILSTKVSRGRMRFKVPLHSGRETHIDLETPTLFRLPAPDNRERSMRITKIEFVPQP